MSRDIVGGMTSGLAMAAVIYLVLFIWLTVLTQLLDLEAVLPVGWPLVLLAGFIVGAPILTLMGGILGAFRSLRG